MIYKFLKNCDMINFFFEERFIYDTEKPSPKPQRASFYAIDMAGQKPQQPDKKEDKKEEKPPEKPKPPSGPTGKPEEPPAEAVVPPVHEVRERRRKRARKIERVQTQAVQDRDKIFERLVKLGIFKDDAERQKYVDIIKAEIEKLKPEDLLKFVKDHNEYNGDYETWNNEFCTLLGKKDLDPDEQRKYIAGLQAFLTDEFANAQPPVKFELKDGKRINKFTYVDGFLGGYTVSVLGVYITSDKYKNRDSNWKRDELYAKLKPEYAEEDEDRKDKFDKALAHLRGQLAVQPAVPGGPPAGAKAPASTPGAKPAPAPAPPPRPAVAKLYPEEQAKKDKEWNEALQRAQRSEQLRKNADTLIDKTLREDKTHWAENIAKIYSSEFAKLSDKYGGDPDRVGRFSEFRRIPVFYGNDNIWPAEIFKKYKEAYDQVTKNPSAENIKRKDELYQMLSKSAADYSQLTKEIVAKLKGKYEPGLRVLIGSYELPHDVYIYNLEPIKLSAGAQGRSWKKEEPEQYKKQREAIERVELQNPDKIDEFYAKYFKEPPKRAFDNWDALAKMLKSPKDLEDYFIGVSPEGIVARVRQIILYRNMHRVYWESEWYKSEFNKELGIAIKALDSNFETYYKDYKGIKDKDFVADISSGQVKERPA